MAQTRDVLTHREAGHGGAGAQRCGEPGRHGPAGDGQAGQDAASWQDVMQSQ